VAWGRRRETVERRSHLTIVWAVTARWQDRCDRLFQTLVIAETVRGRQIVEEGERGVHQGRETCIFHEYIPLI